MKSVSLLKSWAILGFCIALISCGKGSSSTYGSTNNNNNNNPGTVTIANMSFGPTSLTVKAGTTVTWTNNDNMSHTVTADDNSFDSGTLAYTASFSYKFITTGTFNYHCKFHSSMLATVIVN